MKKRFLALVLSVAMVLSFLPFSAFASPETSPYASGLNDTAYYLMKIPEGEQLGKSNVSNNFTVGNQFVGPIREEDGERFVVYNEETSYHSSRNEDAFTYNGWTPGINAPLFTYEEAVNGLPASIPMPTTGEGEEQVEDASTLWIALRIKINDNGAAFEKTTSALRLYFANGGSNAMVNGSDKPAKWLDLNDGSMTWFYVNSGDNKGSSNDLQFTGDMNGYLMIPFSSTSMTAADLRASFSGFAFRFVTGTTSTAATGCKESSWEDKEFLVGDAFLVSDPEAFQTARTKGIKKYAPNGGEDTAYHAVRIGGYRTRYSGIGIDSKTYNTAYFDKDYADPDLAGGKTSGAVVHITTLPNGDRAVEIKVNRETVAVKDPETGEAVTDPETGEPVTEEVGMAYNSGSQYIGIPSYDTYDFNKDGDGTSADRLLVYSDKAGIPDEIDFSKVKYLAVRVAAVGGEGKTYLFNAGIGYLNTSNTAYSTTVYPRTKVDKDTWQTYTYVDVNTGEVYDLTSATNGHKIKAGFDGYVLFPLEDFTDLNLTTLEESFGFYPLGTRPSIKVRMCAQDSINGKWDDGESALYYGGALWVEDKEAFTAYHTDCDNLGHNYKETGRTGADCENPGSITYVCERCDEPHAEPIPALGHEYGELISAVGETHTATELAPAVAAHYQCSVCEKYFTEEKVETTLDALTSATPSHSYDTFVNTDESQHWKECACGNKIELADHDYTTPNKDDTHHWNECVCGKIDEKVEHDFATVNKDADNHWKECACGAKSEITSHDYVEVVADQYLESAATCVSKAIYKKSCSVCGIAHATETFEAGEIDETKHVPAATWSTDGTEHWKECDVEGCEAKLEKAEHTYNTLKNDDNNHWYECVCGKDNGKVDHSGGTATCQNKAVCETCLLAYGELAPCDFIEVVADQYLESAATCVAKAIYKKSCSVCGAAHATETFEAGEIDETKHVPAATWSTDGTEHWKECDVEGCEAKFEKAAHSGGTANCKDKAVCATCQVAYGTVNAENHVGDTELRDVKPTSCDEFGYTGDTWCKSCNTKIADGQNIDKDPHIVNEWNVTKKATAEETGEKSGICVKCEQTISVTTAKLVSEIKTDNVEGLVDAKVEAVGDANVSEDVFFVANEILENIDPAEKTKVENAIKALLGADKEHKFAAIFDLKLVLREIAINGDVISEEDLDLEGTVKVTIPVPVSAFEELDDVKLVHIKDDGTAEVVSFELDNGNAVFEAKEFSYYTFVGVAKSLADTPENDPSDTPENEPADKPEDESTDKPEEDKAPQTGENNGFALWIALLMVSAFGVVFTAVIRKKSVR